MLRRTLDTSQPFNTTSTPCYFHAGPLFLSSSLLPPLPWWGRRFLLNTFICSVLVARKALHVFGDWPSMMTSIGFIKKSELACHCHLSDLSSTFLCWVSKQKKTISVNPKVAIVMTILQIPQQGGPTWEVDDPEPWQNHPRNFSLDHKSAVSSTFDTEYAFDFRTIKFFRGLQHEMTIISLQSKLSAAS